MLQMAIKQKLYYACFLLWSVLLCLSIALQEESGQQIDQVITFGPNDSTVALNFNVIDDDITLEPTESFDWILELVTVVDRVSIEPFRRTNIQIMDDDSKY